MRSRLNILFSLTTTPLRAPHIQPCIGSLACTPSSEVSIVYNGHDIRTTQYQNVSLRRYTVRNDGPFVKYFGGPQFDDPRYVIVCDDDWAYSPLDIEALVFAMDASGRTGLAFQAKGIGGTVKPGGTGIKWWSQPCSQARPVDIITASSMVCFTWHDWLRLGNEVGKHCNAFSDTERLADDYTVSRILRGLGITVLALPIQNTGFPRSYALPYSHLPDALHATAGGNNRRYMQLLKEDVEKGNLWWETNAK